MIDQHGDFNIFNDAYKSKIISLCQQSHDGNTTLYIQSNGEKGHRMNIWNTHLSTSNSSCFCYYSKIDVKRDRGFSAAVMLTNISHSLNDTLNSLCIDCSCYFQPRN